MKSRSTLYFRYFTYIKPFTKLPIIKNYGPSIFTLLTMSILILFAIKPTVETILVLQKKIADSEQVLQKVTTKANNLSLGKKNYDNLDKSIKDQISTAIPNNVALQSLIHSLEQTAQTHQATISALQVQPLTIDTKLDDKMRSLTEVSFTFNTQGSYKNLVALLQDLKVSSRLISIDSLSMTNSEGSGLNMSLSGKAYYLK